MSGFQVRAFSFQDVKENPEVRLMEDPIEFGSAELKAQSLRFLRSVKR